MNFRQRVERLVASIPKGRVMTYGQIAVLVGEPRAPRQVGGTAHFGDPNLPWHRVVNAQGGLASGFPGGRGVQEMLLAAEGVDFTSKDDGVKLDLEVYRWHPGA